MAVSKKPRKQHQPKAIVKPLNMRNDWKIEGDALSALTAMGTEHFNDHHLGALAAHVTLAFLITTDCPEHTHAQSGMLAVKDVMERFERTGTVLVTSIEEHTIRKACETTLEVVRRAPNKVIFDASLYAYRRAA